jgi:hypothetical protein
MIDTTLNLICIRESFKHWLFGRLSLTEYSSNRDPIVKTGDNVYCVYDRENSCQVKDPSGLYQTIKSPGVGENDSILNQGMCNAVGCSAWSPSFILDRFEVSPKSPTRVIVIDWLNRDVRMTGTHLLQLTVASQTTQDDPSGYKLISLRNALVDALNKSDPPSAKSIPIYSPTRRGFVRPYLEGHEHIDRQLSYITPYAMVLTPMGSEEMSRSASAKATISDRSAFIQASNPLGDFMFTFRLAVCQKTESQGAFS